MDKHVILLFITHLHKIKLSHSTINVYLSAVRSLQVMAGLPDPDFRSPQVKLALKAVQANNLPPKKKYPIDYDLLCQMFNALQSDSNTQVWQAIICLAFFAGLRGSEYTAHELGQVKKHVTLDQVVIDYQKTQPIMYFTVSQSKTSQHSYSIPLGCTKVPVCPICTMVKYLSNYQSAAISCNQPVSACKPLFVLNDGTIITKRLVNEKIKQLAATLGLDPTHYSTHSIRAGAATTAAKHGFHEWEIMRLGGWKSATYMSYIRHLDTHVAGFSARLASK